MTPTREDTPPCATSTSARLRWPTLVVTRAGLVILATFLLAPTR